MGRRSPGPHLRSKKVDGERRIVPKVAYLDEATAQAKVDELRADGALDRVNDGGMLSPYCCPECGAWHLGRRRADGNGFGLSREVLALLAEVHAGRVTWHGGGRNFTWHAADGRHVPVGRQLRKLQGRRLTRRDLPPGYRGPATCHGAVLLTEAGEALLAEYLLAVG